MSDTEALPLRVEESPIALDALRLRLAAVLEPEVVADIVLGEGLRAFGAASGSLCVLDPARRWRSSPRAGYSDEVLDTWTTFPLARTCPLRRRRARAAPCY